ncbi:MAG TPA: hypothetical protein VJ802_13005 [Gemmatimonadaceae bacterium]|nr:hypothetical protein [Gemmatimonadaceae bacterium]
MVTVDPRSSEAILAVVRRVLAVILVLAMAGILVELLLIEHFEDAWQLVPLILLGLGLVGLAWHTVAPNRPSARAFGILMALFIIAGFVGFYMHYTGNVEFELEQTPTAARWVLFREAMMGATPALAPGAMIQIGLIGLLYAYVSKGRQR